MIRTGDQEIDYGFKCLLLYLQGDDYDPSGEEESSGGRDPQV